MCGLKGTWKSYSVRFVPHSMYGRVHRLAWRHYYLLGTGRQHWLFGPCSFWPVEIAQGEWEKMHFHYNVVCYSSCILLSDWKRAKLISTCNGNHPVDGPMPFVLVYLTLTSTLKYFQRARKHVSHMATCLDSSVRRRHYDEIDKVPFFQFLELLSHCIDTKELAV